MPLGIVSDADFERELRVSQSPITPILTEVLPLEPEHGRKRGDRNVPDSLRKLIGDIAVTEGRKEALALARDFGVSDSSVSAYTKGATSTATIGKTPNAPHINLAKERIGKQARIKLKRALAYITDEKLQHTDAKDLAAVAKSLSSVSKDMEPSKESDSDGKIQPQFVVYSPTIVQENHFETINAREDVIEAEK